MSETRLGDVLYYYQENDGGDNAYIPDELRRLGVHLVGAKGSGKSMLLGRYMACSDYLREIPCVIFDTGDVCDNLLFELFCKWTLEPDQIKERRSRLVYVNMAGSSDFVTPFPFYYRFGSETDYQVAARFPDIVAKLDPELKTASIQGFNALLDAAIPAGMELINRGWQITEMEQVVKTIPPSLRVKLIPFEHDPIQRAMYGASMPGIDWQEVIDKKLCVILDFRHFLPSQAEAKRLAILWSFQTLLEFIQYRGIGQTPISLIIDELFDFTSSTALAQDSFANDLNTFINTTMRRHNIWLTVAHQEMSQFAYSKSLQNLLLGLHTQIVGSTLLRDDALMLSRRLFIADTSKIKRQEIKWDVYDTPIDTFRVQRTKAPVDLHDIDSPLYEQYHDFATKEIETIKPLDFLLWKPERQSDEDLFHKAPLQFNIPFSISWEEKGHWIDENWIGIIANCRRELSLQRKLSEVLDEIAARSSSSSSQNQPPRPIKKLPV